MTEVQKIIKYGALAFAFFLIFSIVAGFMQLLLLVTNVFTDDDRIMDNLEELKITEGASVLDIDVSSSNVVIQVGSELKAETNNSYISVEQKNDKLFIKEKKKRLFFGEKTSSLVITVPQDFVFDGVFLDAGMGSVTVEKLTTKDLDFNLGAGTVTMDALYVTDTASIEGGAGKIEIKSGEIHNLELDMGVGELLLTSKITGNSEIDAGVGKIDIGFIGSRDDYKIIVDKGLGSALIDGEKIKDDMTYGNGANRIDIDGGVGSMIITFEG